VLELACGPGGLGLAVAEGFPGSEVTLSDVAPRMTAIAAARAEERGLGNVTVRELDLERIEEADETFDVVFCREGLMLVPEPGRAAAEMRRVLRPGGRVALSVWGPGERNPWLSTLLEALGAELGGTFPPPGMPGPLALGDPEMFRGAVSEGGFGEIEITEVDLPWRGASTDEWWERTVALAGPVAKLLEAQPDEVVDAIRERSAEALSRYETAGGLEIPGLVLVASAKRP
jgi:SAM-dependent methyltransferase